jgi:transcriptional regulator with XRE-family HTH domain
LTDVATPIAARRLLAAELRRLRGVTGYTLDDIAGRMECSAAKLSRIETGQGTARLQDVREMADLYRVDPDTREQLLTLARMARQTHWASQYPEAVGDTTRQLLGLEANATAIHTYANHTIPDLLQTPDYANALEAAQPGLRPHIADQRAAVHARRQELLTQTNPPTLIAVIDESALHRPTDNPDITAGQHAALIETATTQPHVTLHILPLTASALACAATPFTILTFPHPNQPAITYTGTSNTPTLHNDPHTVNRHHDTFHLLRTRALNPAASIELIRHAHTQ